MRLFGKKDRSSHELNSNDSAVSNPAEFQKQAAALIPAEVRMISGCHSEETSADVSNVSAVAKLPNPAGRAGGACTSALLEILYRKQPQNLTFQALLLELRASLARTGMSQVPQLSSSRPLELQTTPFYLVGGAGRRRAVLVGINYGGQNGELSGCHNDVFNVKNYIMKVHGFPEQDVLVMVDDGRHAVPTRQKIIAALQQLVRDSVSGDSIYFHYSGHGGLLSPEGLNAFKGSDKYDETLYPVDHERAGQIRDFSLFNHFVKPLAAGVTATCVMDCCHSGTVLELPYSFQPTAGGGIRSFQNMNSLSNLAFLYILAGGILPPGFRNVEQHIEDNVDGDLVDYQGVGLEEMEADAMEGGYDDISDMGGDTESPEYGNAGGDNLYGNGTDDVVVVQGAEVDPETCSGDVVQGMPADPEAFGGGTDAYGETMVQETYSDPYGRGVSEEFGMGGDEYPQTVDRAFDEYGDGDYNVGGADDGAGEDADCGCIAELLGALLQGDDG